MVQPVTSGGITRVIQQEYDAIGSCIFRVLNEFLHHIVYTLEFKVDNLLLDCVPDFAVKYRSDHRTSFDGLTPLVSSLWQINIVVVV